MIARCRSIVGVVVLAALSTASAVAMQINVVPGAALQANGDALAAFQRAADAWDALFSDPIQLTINADIMALSEPNLLGVTQSVVLQGSYNLIRNALVADSAGTAGKEIVASLPTAAQFGAFVPTGDTLTGNLIATKADLKAMGFAGLDSAFGPTDANMTFNSNFNFYYGSGAVPSGMIDFQTVVTHELGHALGFISAVDAADFFLSQNTTGALDVAVLDLYRFDGTLLPTTSADFTTTPRSLLPGRTSYLSDTTVQYSMSTGAFTGDGWQASHWKDDGLTGVHIGVMDPTLASGIAFGISDADIRAMELIGYDRAVPEPGTLALMAGAFAVFTAVRRRRGKKLRG